MSQVLAEAREAIANARDLNAEVAEPLPDGVLAHRSIVGSRFTGTVIDRTQVAGREAVVPMVSGTAYRTGEHVFLVDPRDDLVPGFVLR